MRDQLLHVITTSYQTPIELPYNPHLSPTAQLAEWQRQGILTGVGAVTVWRVRPKRRKRTSRKPRVYLRISRVQMETPWRFQHIHYESYIELVPAMSRQSVAPPPSAPPKKTGPFD